MGRIESIHRGVNCHEVFSAVLDIGDRQRDEKQQYTNDRGPLHTYNVRGIVATSALRERTFGNRQIAPRGVADCWGYSLLTLCDQFSRRQLILALGRAHAQHWFKQRKAEINEFPVWARRAFLAAASCLPGDEALHWYHAISGSLDPLDKVVVDWAKANRF
jgi:hypothetical protein